MNILTYVSNIMLSLLFVLDIAYTFVTNNKVVIKPITKTLSEKDLYSTAVLLEDPIHLKSIKYIESFEYLEDGEVVWEIPIKIFPSHETKMVGPTTQPRPVEYEFNIAYSVISGISKGLNKEIFRLDTVYDIILTAKSNNYFSDAILLFFVVFVKYTNIIIVQGEVDEIKKSYKETNSVEWMERHLKIRRFTSTILLLLAFILTKNVEIVE